MRRFRDWARVTVATVACVIVAFSARAETSARELTHIKDRFVATFPHTPVEEVRDSELPGLFEIYTAGHILYYAPKQNSVLFGEMYSANGVSVTQQKLDARFQGRVAHIDKSVALVVGEGPTELIAFVDPDCIHCQHAHDWLAEQKFTGVKELIYFMPMRGRPGAEARATQAVCAPPELRQEAVRQVFHPDPHSAGQTLRCPQAQEVLEKQAEIAQAVGVSGTPTFVVKGQAITGFDRERLAALLTDRKE